MKIPWKAVPCAVAAGCLNGLFGAGGGMLLVPLLQKYTSVSQRELFASALAIMLPLSLVSFLVSLRSGTGCLSAGLPYVIGGALGGILGGMLYKKISTALLHRALGLFIVWGGMRCLL